MVLHQNAASGAVYSGSARQRPTFCIGSPTGKGRAGGDALIAHGFPEETMQQDDGFSVYVRDPDGNKIELYGKRTEV
jgi:catechol 2,3-dioxygenase-like lactoylglutathione lyase family enzyme